MYRHDEASFPSRMTFSWLLPLVRLGYRTPLEAEDLCSLPERERAKVQYQAVRGRVEREGILKACVSMNAGLIVSGGVYRLLADTFGFAGALSIKLIVDAMSEGTADIEVTIIYCKQSTEEVNGSVIIFLLSPVLLQLHIDTSKGCLSMCGGVSTM